MKKIFKYRGDSEHHNEYKHGDECEIIGFLWHDELGPLVMTLHLSSGYLVAVNPSRIEFVREESMEKKDFLKAIDELGDVLGKYWEDVDDVDEELRKIRRGEI